MSNDFDSLNQLRTTLRKMELALGAVDEGLVWVSADGRVQWCNTTFARQVERPADEVLGSRLAQVLQLEQNRQPVPAAAHPARRAFLAERQPPEVYELPQIGGVREVEITTSRVRMDENELSAVLVIRDVTEQRRAAARIREAEARYRLLLDNIPAIMYMDAVDEHSSNLYTSPYVETLLGYTVEEWVSDQNLWVQLLHPADRERVLAEHARTNTTGDPFRIEYRLTHRDGRTVWVQDEAVMLHDPDGKPMYWLGVITDISKRKES